ncbi:MAG: hypothetical protein ABIP33_06520 [Pseudolysinimonas sp.]
MALFTAAGVRRGRTLYFNTQRAGAEGDYLACWRSYATQDYLYEGSIHHLPGFNTASNPNTGQRNHMRGAAGDLVLTDAETQAACREVGLIRDTVEDWHWNDPNWAHMHIIPSFTTTAGDGSNPFDNTIPKEHQVTDTTVFQMIDPTGKDVSDWSRIGPGVLPVGTFKGGYEATADHDTAVLWINGSGQTNTGPIKLPRAEYLAQQQWGAKEYTLHHAADVATIKEALGK